MATFQKGSPSVGPAPSGYAAAAGFGTPSVSSAVSGYAAAAAFGGVPIATAFGWAAPATFGAAPVATAFGRTATAAFGGVPAAVPAGYAAPAAFGAPSVERSFTVSGYAASTAFGGVPIATAFGWASPAAFGGVPASTTFGFGIPAAFGAVPIAVPFGLAAPAAFGQTPAVVPSGYAVASAFGTPTVTTTEIAVTFVDTGTEGFADNNTITPGLPTGWTDGDFLLSPVFYSSPNGSIATPAGWTLRDTIINNDGKLYTYWRFAVSGDAAPSFVPSGGSAGDAVLGGIMGFRSVNPSAPFGGTDGNNTTNTSTINILISAANATGVNNGAVVAIGARNSGFTAATTLTGDGLTWFDPLDFSEGSLGAYLDGQYATWTGAPPSLTDKTIELTGSAATSYGKMYVLQPQGVAVALTITPSGLATTAAIGNELAATVFGRAAPAAFGTPGVNLNISVGGYAAAAAFGGVPAATAFGKAAPAAFGAVSAAVPRGYAASTAFGAVPATTAFGKASTTAFGGAPAAVPFGYGAASAFGAPSVSITLSVSGRAVSSAFGGVPAAVPAGYSAAAAFGTPSVVVAEFTQNLTPSGYAATAAFGNVPAATPFGRAIPAAFGGAPAAVPRGYAAPAAFGAPSVERSISVSGVAATAAFGNVPAAVPSGRASSSGFGLPPVAVPGGLAVAAAFGTPTVIVSGSIVVISSVAPTLGSGLTRARKTLEDLVAEWYRLEQERKKATLRAARLEREKATIKTKRKRAVIDLSAERRLDNMIVAANRAYVMLEEREQQFLADVRAYQVNVEDISRVNRQALADIEEGYATLLREDDEAAILALL